MEHKLPDLEYDYDALAPAVSAETMELHHSKHHQTYVTNLNNLIKGTEYEQKSLEEIVTSAPAGGIFNNAGQHWNHCEFWKMLTPQATSPSDALTEKLNKHFGSIENFKAEFEKTGLGTFGSGWVWLAQNSDGSLELLSSSNAGNPLHHGKKALLGVDVWEHAYYVDYRNRRPDYLKNIWQVVNWDYISDKLA